MERRNSRRSYNDGPSNLKQRRFSQFDRNGESDRFEDALNGVTKKFKAGDRFVPATKDDLLEIDCKNEKIKLVNDVKTDGLDENQKVEKFRISEATRDHLKGLGITHLFPIQSATFDHIFEESDLIGRDRTGSGKTLSYVLPICENFRTKGIFKNRNGQKPLCLVVLPTRELVIQVTNVFNTIKYMDDEFRVLPIYGGTEIRAQIMDIKRGAEVIVGTPGRIMDLMERGVIAFTELKVIVLDEADQMLDMGFQEDIEKIYQAIHTQVSKEKLQSILLSATLPSWVHEVSRKYLREQDLIKIDLIKDKGYKTATNIKHLAINCPYFSRNGAIGDIVLCYGGQHARTIIFTETKKEANDIMLEAHIKQECQVLHGDIPQKQREITFRAFREGKFKCLIATNVAARGLDIPEVDLIIQLSPPKEVDTYIHRSGRTARAGRTGVCVTFYMKKQLDLMDRIERQANFKFQKVGAPQPTDIIKANARDIVTSIKKVPHEVVGLFDDIVGELIDNIGAKEALSRALAIISGTNEKFKQRSLLCSIEGFITYVVETDVEFRNLAFIWTFLKRYFSAEITDSIKGMRAYQSKRGAAFDVPEQYEEDIQNFIDSNPVTKNYTLKKIDALPELEEEGGNARGGNGGGNSGYGNSRVIKGRDDVKVFVGGLAYDSTEQHIQDFFRNEGVNPADVLVLRDNDGKSRGVAFVIFNSREDALAATRSNAKRLQGRALRINMASDKPGGSGGRR